MHIARPPVGRPARLDCMQIHGMGEAALWEAARTAVTATGCAGDVYLGDAQHQPYFDSKGFCVGSGRMRGTVPRTLLSSQQRCVAAAAAQAIPIQESGQLAEACNIRLEELNVIDLKFLHGCARPTIALLYQDPKGMRHARTYVVDLKQKARASCRALKHVWLSMRLFRYCGRFNTSPRMLLSRK